MLAFSNVSVLGQSAIELIGMTGGSDLTRHRHTLLFSHIASAILKNAEKKGTGPSETSQSLSSSLFFCRVSAAEKAAVGSGHGHPPIRGRILRPAPSRSKVFTFQSPLVLSAVPLMLLLAAGAQALSCCWFRTVFGWCWSLVLVGWC